jgi:hypothetical protein
MLASNFEFDFVGLFQIATFEFGIFLYKDALAERNLI